MRGKTYFDTKERGLAFRVTPTRAKSWKGTCIACRAKGPQWLTLGPYPELSLADARACRPLIYRRAVHVEKKDPIADRRARARGGYMPVKRGGAAR